MRLNELPPDIARKLPEHLLPVAVLAWLGVDKRDRGRGLGDRLLAQALLDCHEAGKRIRLDDVDPRAGDAQLSRLEHHPHDHRQPEEESVGRDEAPGLVDPVSCQDPFRLALLALDRHPDAKA